MKDKPKHPVNKKGNTTTATPNELLDKAITIVAKKLAEKKRKDLGL